jgi:hypothetical protein
VRGLSIAGIGIVFLQILGGAAEPAAHQASAGSGIILLPAAIALYSLYSSCKELSMYSHAK